MYPTPTPYPYPYPYKAEGDDEYKARFPDLFAALDAGGRPHPVLAQARTPPAPAPPPSP